MLAISERVLQDGDRAEVRVWHKPVGHDPDTAFQRIACSDSEGIVMPGGKREVPLRLDKPGERWCTDCLAIIRTDRTAEK